MEPNTEGSPRAAQGAPHTKSYRSKTKSTRLKGLLGLLAGSTVNKNDSDQIIQEDDPDPLGTLPASTGEAGSTVANVKDVMVQRADIVAVPVNVSIEDLVDTFKKSERTRIPVYNESLDNPLGFVHLKDIALSYGFNSTTQSFNATDNLRDLIFVPPSMPISKLREKMQNARCHIALVIDEYGGVDGLVTIEDLLEHHFGEIIDEHDTHENIGTEIRKVADGTIVCEGKTAVEDIEEIFGRSLIETEEDEEIDTIGGWVSSLVNRIPASGEFIKLDNAKLAIKILDADARRIKLLQISQVS